MQCTKEKQLGRIDLLSCSHHEAAPPPRRRPAGGPAASDPAAPPCPRWVWVAGMRLLLLSSPLWVSGLHSAEVICWLDALGCRCSLHRTFGRLRWAPPADRTRVCTARSLMRCSHEFMHACTSACICSGDYNECCAICASHGYPFYSRGSANCECYG